jgi:hypothetical protein
MSFLSKIFHHERVEGGHEMPWCAPSASTAGLLLSDGTTWVAGVPGVLSTSGLLGQSGGATPRREAIVCCMAGVRASSQGGALTLPA